MAPKGYRGRGQIPFFFSEHRAQKDVLHTKNAPDVTSFLASLPQEGSGLMSATLDNHLSYFRSLGLTYGEVVANRNTERSLWYQGLPCRCQQLVACVQKRWPSVLGVDTSQSMSRSPFLKVLEDGRVEGPAILPRSSLYVMGEHQRLLTGEEALEGQGFPVARYRHVCEKFSNAFKQDLAGNAFAYTIIEAILITFLFITDFKQAQQSPTCTTEVQICCYAGRSCSGLVCTVHGAWVHGAWEPPTYCMIVWSLIPCG